MRSIDKQRRKICCRYIMTFINQKANKHQALYLLFDIVALDMTANHQRIRRNSPAKHLVGAAFRPDLSQQRN